jgi:PhnB protein
LDEALAWVKRRPNPYNQQTEIEIRPLFEAKDFATNDPTGEVRAAQARLREQVRKRHG